MSERSVTAPPRESALESLCGACGVEYDPIVGGQAWAAAMGETRPLPRLAMAARDVGLRLTQANWTAREALHQVRPGVALVAPTPEGSYVVVVDRSGGQALLDDGRWVGAHELGRSVGATDDRATLEWALAEPISPCSDLGGPPPGEDHGDHGDPHGPSPLRRLWGILRPEWRDVWVVIVFAFGVGILSLSVPITVEAIVSTVQPGNVTMLTAVIVLALVLLGCLLLAGLMRALSAYVVELIQRRVFVRVVGELAYRLPRVRAEAFDRQHGPELVNRFFDVLTVQKASATLLLDGVSVVIQALIGLVVLAIWHPYLLGFNLALLVSMTLFIWLLGWGAVASKIRESLAKYAVAGWLEEMVRYPLAFKLPAGQEYALQRADALTRDYLVRRQQSFRILFRQIVFGFFLQAVGSSALLGLGGWLVIRNELTSGQLVAAELIIVVIVGSFVKLGKSLESYYDLLAGMDKLGHLVDLPLENEQGERLFGVTGPARVALRQVSYSYADDHGHPTPLLRQVTADVAPGERIALIGPSGAGKSTLAEILYGLREPTSGHVELDGYDLRDLRLESLRQQVASVVGAEAFDGTILDNVRLGRPGVSLSDVTWALAMVGLLDEVRGLPAGLRTPLAGGSPLSRGQLQRLMLARAIAGRPRLLLLDGPLDELDPRTRSRVIVGLFARDNPWTLIAITNNPDVLAACDRSLSLEGPASTH